MAPHPLIWLLLLLLLIPLGSAEIMLLDKNMYVVVDVEVADGCPAHQNDTETCKSPTLEAGRKMSCPADKTLNVNGVPVKGSIKCDEQKGWADTGDNTFIIDFAKIKAYSDSNFDYYCYENCGAKNIRTECEGGANCVRPTLDASGTKLECQPKSDLLPLVFQRGLYDHAVCSSKGWTSSPGDQGVTLVDFAKDPFTTIEAACHNLCHNDMITDVCMTSNCKNAKPEFKTHLKLTCPNNYFVRVDYVNYKELECSAKGLIGNRNILVDYVNHPFQKIRVKCQPYCDHSLVIDTCTLGDCAAKPIFNATTSKLECSVEGYFFE